MIWDWDIIVRNNLKSMWVWLSYLICCKSVHVPGTHRLKIDIIKKCNIWFWIFYGHQFWINACRETLRLWSHRSIRYTVLAIRYTICAPPQTRFFSFHATSCEYHLWRRANRIAYCEYHIAYTSMWSQPQGRLLNHKTKSW